MIYIKKNWEAECKEILSALYRVLLSFLYTESSSLSKLCDSYFENLSIQPQVSQTYGKNLINVSVWTTTHLPPPLTQH